MDHRYLGRTGVQVSKLCLGAMMFGAWGNPDHDESIRIIHRALDAGVNFIDTADVDSAGASEEIVGKAISSAPSRRDDVVLATKVSVPMDDEANHRGNSRRWIVQEIENSLRRLGTGWIDLSSSSNHSFPPPRSSFDDTLLDRIDAIVDPGTNLNPADTSYGEAVLAPAARRQPHRPPRKDHP